MPAELRGATALRVVRAEARPLLAPLARPFGIASGGLGARVENCAVHVELSDGARGWGEVAALPGVTPLAPGAPTLAAAQEAAAWLRGRASPAAPLLRGGGPPGAAPWALARALEAAFPGPAFSPVRAGIEAALLDACARRAGLPLWRLLRRECALAGVAGLPPDAGGPAPLATDISIPLCTAAEAHSLAREYRRRGFRAFKVKVGGPEGWEAGAARAAAVARAVAGGPPGACALLVDGNEGLAEREAGDLLESLAGAGALPRVLEQPCAAGEHAAAARLRVLCEEVGGDRAGAGAGAGAGAALGISLVADEGCQGPRDAARIATGGEAHGVNLKLAKSGLLGALETAAVARAAGLGLMIGGMVETRLGMGTAAHLAGALGGFSEVDLDTPLLLAGADRISGGYTYDGARLDLGCAPGHGMTPRESE